MTYKMAQNERRGYKIIRAVKWIVYIVLALALACLAMLITYTVMVR